MSVFAFNYNFYKLLMQKQQMSGQSLKIIHLNLNPLENIDVHYVLK